MLRLYSSVVALTIMLIGASPAVAQEADTAAAEPSARATTEVVDAGPHPLWRVTSGSDTLHVMGSVHLLRPEVYPLDPVMQTAIESADKVVFEIDLDSMQNAGPKFMQRGLYEGDKTIEDELADTTYTFFASTLDSLGIPPSNVKKMKPWFLSITLSGIVLQRSGYDTQAGIEQHVYRAVNERDERVEVAGLETIDEQIEMFASMGEDDPNEYMYYTLKNLSESVAQIDRITEAWKAGNVQAIANLMNEGMEEYPEFRERLLTRRNENWIAPIEALMKEDQRILVVVGVGHLVGEDSVVDLLREKGYTVTQL